MRTFLAGPEGPRARARERLLEAGCEDVRVADSHGQLAESLCEWPEALVVIGGDALSARPYLQVAVRAGSPALILLGGRPGESGQAMIAAGARGALHEDIPAPSLAAALGALRSGLIVLDPALEPAAGPAPGKPDPFTRHQSLTRREQQILALIATGASNKLIARRLEVSSNTVKFHLAAIFAKLSVATRAEAVAEAIRRGQLSL